MTKSDIVNLIAHDTSSPVSAAALMLDVTLDGMKDALQQGNGIELRGFGIFRVRMTKARVGRNPQTGEPVQIPARKKVSFRWTGKLE